MAFWTPPRAGAHAWRRAATAHDLDYAPTAPVPAGPGAGPPFTRGADRQVSHVLTGAVPATVGLARGPGAAGVRATWFAACTVSVQPPLGSRRQRQAYGVVEVTLPAPLPPLVLADRDYAATFGAAAGRVVLTAHRALHDRFEVGSPDAAFVHALLTPEVVQAALELPGPALLFLDRARLRLVTGAPAGPAQALARLAQLQEVVAAVGHRVWQVAGLPVRGPARPAPGWERGIPAARPAPLPAGPAWR